MGGINITLSEMIYLSGMGIIFIVGIIINIKLIRRKLHERKGCKI